MPPRDTDCPIPDLRDTAQAVVDAVEHKNTAGALQLVNEFWREHHNDEEWKLFREQMHIDESMLTLGKKDNDPLVKMFNNFEIVMDLKYDLDPPPITFQPGNMDPSHDPGREYPPGKGDSRTDPGYPFNPDGHGHPPTGSSDGTQRGGTPPITNEDAGKDERTVFYRQSGPF